MFIVYELTADKYKADALCLFMVVVVLLFATYEEANMRM